MTTGTNVTEPTLQEIKVLIDEQGRAFEEFKKVNDQRISEIARKGAADPVTLEKLAKIEATLAKGEDYNNRLVAADAAIKGLKDDLDKERKHVDEIEKRLNRPGAVGADAAERKKSHNLWLRAAANAITVGVMNLPAEQQKALQASVGEYKALGLTPDTAGGYLAPQEYVREIIKAETEMSPVRSLVRIRETMSKSIQIPKRTGQFSAVWVSEHGTRSETTGLAYGLEEIHCHEVYALVDISNQQLEDSAFDMESELRMEAAEQFAVAEGTAVVSGSGAGRPEGFLTNSSVLSTNSGAATEITADGLLTLKHEIKTAYTRNANYVLNRTTLGKVRRLKDGNGQYLWMMGIAAGRPNTIDGDPYVELPDMPNEAASAYPVAYGDFRRAYTMVDRLAVEFLRDPYTQATAGNVRFIFRRRIGGQVVLAEAIRKLKCST